MMIIKISLKFSLIQGDFYLSIEDIEKVHQVVGMYVSHNNCRIIVKFAKKDRLLICKINKLIVREEVI